MLFGVFATHNPESCPLNNKESKKMFTGMKRRLDSNLKKFNITKLIGFYMSVLEHEWIIILDAKNAHDIEQFCIAVEISSISIVKIVPLSDLSTVLKKLEGKK